MDSTDNNDVPEFMMIRQLEVSDGVKLRHLSYYPENPKGHVLLYPGMNTLVLSWYRVLELLKEENFAIDYVESREKHTAELKKDSEISKERMLSDCIEAIDILNLVDDHYIVLASSLGSNTMLHCLSKGEISPKHVILVGPVAIFKMPTIFKFLLPFTNRWTYQNVGKRIMQKIIIRKYTNEKADPMQKKKYVMALEVAEPIRLKKTLYAWHGKSVLEDLENINGNQAKCLVIGATEDKLHDVEETKLIADSIKGAEYVDLKTNTSAHDRPIVDLIVKLSN